MSAYNRSQFIGFAACFPRVLPEWLYKKLFCPPQKNLVGGLATVAPAGIRRVESALCRAGIPEKDIAVAYPDNLEDAVGPETKVIGISTSDPMGLGPASSTFSKLLGRETYTRHFFRKLLTSPSIRSSGARIIVGGPGTWQLLDSSTRKSLGIDCIVDGEGDLLAPDLFMDAIEGRPLPSIVTGGPVPIDQIPMIRGATVNGTVEISRGCGRGCQFCNPNMRQVRHIPLDRILGEVRINLRAGDKITLHAEDVLRYRANGLKPNREEVSGLFQEVGKMTGNVGLSHIALSSALSEPAILQDISEVVTQGNCHEHVYAQTGIETGSPDLVSKHMKGKAKPFSPEEWPDVVRESFKHLSDNDWVPCGTLVMGMPGERPEDVEKTIELVRDLREHKCLIVPLFFVPLGTMTDSDFFTTDDMCPEHWMLLAECIDHDFHWAGVLMNELFAKNRISTAKSQLFKLAAWYMKYRMKGYLEEMREGRSPLEMDGEMHAGRDLETANA